MSVEVLLGASPGAGPACQVHRRSSSAATVNNTNVKSGPARLLKVYCRNNVATLRYLKLYNTAGAAVVGTDVPRIVLPLAGSTNITYDLVPFGLDFSLGLSYAITANVADSDTTAIAAADILAFSLVYI